MTIVDSHEAAFDHDEFRRAIGGELRSIRRGRLNWSRAKQLSHLRDMSDVGSTQTLTTYELGTRDMSLTRFVELCRVMGVRPSDVLASVESAILDAADLRNAPWRGVDDKQGVSRRGIEVDLKKLSRLSEGPLTPLANWACTELWSGTTLVATTRTLSPDALDTMAGLCGLDLATLLDEIARIHERRRAAT